MSRPSRTHRSLIIGAGVAGLTAIKNCLEVGIEPHCFEQHEEIGGIWYYTPHIRPDQGAPSFHNLVTNTSKETNSFTDFHYPDDYPQYMTHKQFLQYLKLYAQHFDLLHHIRFGTRVIRVAPADGFASSGQWDVRVKSRDSEVEEELVFDSVFVCSGQLVKPMEPDLPGRDLYRGKVMHMWHYRTPDVFANKRVLIIGNQHSAGDAAVDAASCAQQVYLSPGRGGLRLVPRLGFNGSSNELYGGLNRVLIKIMSQAQIGKFLVKVSRKYLDPEKYGVKDGGNPLGGGSGMVNDDLQYKIINGSVKLVSPVCSYTESGVILEGKEQLDVDLILLATGYTSDYDFIHVQSVRGKDFRVNGSNALHLYKWVFPLDLQPCTLMMADAINVYGPHVGAVDMRTRWAANVFAGKCALPEPEVMKRHAREERERELQEYNGKVKLVWWDYCDSIADEMGCRPNFWSIFRNSPSVAFKVFLGPILPCHYRLLGPGASPVAWQTSQRVYDRLFPTRRRKWTRTIVYFVLLPILLAWILKMLFWT